MNYNKQNTAYYIQPTC